MSGAPSQKGDFIATWLLMSEGKDNLDASVLDTVASRITDGQLDEAKLLEDLIGLAKHLEADDEPTAAD